MKQPPVENGEDGNNNSFFSNLAKSLASTRRILQILYEFSQDEEVVELLYYLGEIFYK
jgi:hypothetical protein